MSDKPFPMQPIVWVNDVIRFRMNRVVEELLRHSDSVGFGMNQIVLKTLDGVYSDAELIQLYQLIGYSVSGYGDLSAVGRNEEWALRPADAIAAGMHSVVDRLAEVVQPTRQELEAQLAEVSADAAKMAAHIFGDTMDFRIGEVAERYRSQEVESE